METGFFKKETSLNRRSQEPCFGHVSVPDDCNRSRKPVCEDRSHDTGEVTCTESPHDLVKRNRAPRYRKMPGRFGLIPAVNSFRLFIVHITLFVNDSIPFGEQRLILVR